MQPAPKPADEAGRIDTLRTLEILDTAPEERFDRLTRLARRLFSVPIALVSLVDADRQWFKSRDGLEVAETPRHISFCGYAILGNGAFVIEDAASDVRFHDNPLVIEAPQIRFYAGCPLAAPNGSKVGTLCIIDHAPREFSVEDMALLRDLARMVEQEFTSARLATIDELTMLSNRRGFKALSLHALGWTRRLGKPASLLMLDLDEFRQINERFGRTEGDLALQGFSRLLKQTFRDCDVLGRLGGDEFAVLASNAGGNELVGALDRLRANLGQYNETVRPGCQLRYHACAVSFDPARHLSISDLIAQAAALMYGQKRRRRRQPGVQRNPYQASPAAA